MIGLEMRSMASAIVKPRTMQQPAFEVSNSQWPICTQNRPFLVEDATGRFGRGLVSEQSSGTAAALCYQPFSTRRAEGRHWVEPGL